MAKTKLNDKKIMVSLHGTSLTIKPGFPFVFFITHFSHCNKTSVICIDKMYPYYKLSPQISTNKSIVMIINMFN